MTAIAIVYGGNSVSEKRDDRVLSRQPQRLATDVPRNLRAGHSMVNTVIPGKVVCCSVVNFIPQEV